MLKLSMKITIITLFPRMFPGTLGDGLIGKANFQLEVIDLKQYKSSMGNHMYIDQRPFGGGEGMLICPRVIENAMKNIDVGKYIFPSPCGPVFNQQIAERLSKEEHLVFLCGRYEGIDARALNHYNFESISLGDFILCGGEVAAMTIIETIVRLLKGTLSNEDSIINESFYMGGLLEHDHFCELREWQGHNVPQVLLEGNHSHINEWKYKNSLSKTITYRPDLFNKYVLAFLFICILQFINCDFSDIEKIKRKLYFKNLRQNSLTNAKIPIFSDSQNK